MRNDSAPAVYGSNINGDICMTDTYFATCKIGLESVVAGELRDLGIEVLRVSDARVDFAGDYFAMARACLWLRTAERVLMKLASFRAVTFDELYEGENGRRIIIEIGILRDEVTVALDCCGAGLSRRGYRTYNVPAPISETLGAAIVMLSGYRQTRPLIDPMCGSGTMPIEAAMIANNIAPGINREFAAEDWHFLQNNAFAAAREQARDSVRRDTVDISGRDIDPHSIELCKKHAKKAGVMLDWRVEPVQKLRETRTGGVIVCNPPYGERLLEKQSAEELYRQMHGIFSRLDGWSVNIIASHPDFERIYGARADKRRKLSNGGMTCTLYRYRPHYLSPKPERPKTDEPPIDK